MEESQSKEKLPALEVGGPRRREKRSGEDHHHREEPRFIPRPVIVLKDARPTPRKLD